MSVLHGSDIGGVEFFTPDDSPFSSIGKQPDWQAGAWIPGLNKLYGSGRVAVHIYVVDQGSDREVQLVGPHGMGDKGSTERLLHKIASHFR